MVLLLVANDCPNDRACPRIGIPEHEQLFMKVPQHHPLHRDGCSEDSLLAGKTCQNTKERATQPAQPIASASRTSARRKFGTEQCAMVPLVDKEFI